MNRTLKSLLIASVLTLPSVFGAACASGVKDDKASSANQSTSTAVVPLSGTMAATAAADPGLRFARVEEVFQEPSQALIQGKLTPSDSSERFAKIAAGSENPAVVFFGIRPNSSFASILDEAFAKKIWNTKMTKEQHSVIIAAIKSINLTEREQVVLTGILHHSTPEEMRNAAYALPTIRYSADMYATLTEAAAYRPTAKPEDKQLAYLDLSNQGEKHLPTAERLYSEYTAETNPNKSD